MNTGFLWANMLRCYILCMMEQKFNVCKHFKNIFLIDDFYGSLLDKILNIEMRKTHTIVIKKTFVTFLVFCFMMIVTI